AETRRDIRDPVLNQRDQVEITLDEDPELLFPFFVLRLEQSVEMLSFDVCRSFGRVEVFRLIIAHRPGTECDRMTIYIEDGEHDPAAEAVEDTVLFFVDRDEAAL